MEILAMAGYYQCDYTDTATTWTEWNATYTATTDATTTWVMWNSDYGTSTASGSVTYSRISARVQPSEEELRQQRERHEAAVRRQREASERARLSLIETLNHEQRQDFESKRQFIVHTRNGERRYLIEYGRAGNVKLLDEKNRPVEKFCIHPAIMCPNEDVMLSQKLMLETDEAAFLRIANRTDLRSAA